MTTRPRITRPLQDLARRHRQRSLLLALVWGLAAAAAFAALAILGAVAAPWPMILALGAFVFAGGLAWALVHGRLRGEMALAQRIDQDSGLDQAYLTAVDLDRSGAAPGPVGSVLISRMEEAATRIDTARLLPIFDRVLGVAALALVLSAGALAYGLWRADLPVAPQPVEIAMADPLEAARDAAERITADAEAMEDPYLAAVARALQEQLDAAEGSTPAPALEQEIEALLDHAARAYGNDLPDWLGSGENRLDNLAQRLAAADEAEALAAARAEAAAQRRAESSTPYYQQERDGQESFEGRDQEELIAGAGAQSGDAESGGGEPPEGTPPEGPRPMTPQELVFAGRVPVGAALESGKGESDEAGLGTQTFEEDTAYSDLAAGVGEDVVIASSPQEGGNRIRIEIAPEAGSGDAAAGGGAGALGGGAGSGPAAADRVIPALDQLDLVARYLARAPGVIE